MLKLTPRLRRVKLIRAANLAILSRPNSHVRLGSEADVGMAAANSAKCYNRTVGHISKSRMLGLFPEAIGFYVVILAATIIGFAIGFLPINPIQLLVWTAVINGIVAVPIMAMMMLIVTNRKAMGRFQARPTLAWAGWGATALMGVTVVALLCSLLP